MTIGQKIKIARSLRGLTQKELGFLVGLSDVRIRQYEIDARTPKQGILKDIANALGVSSLFFTDHSIDTYNDIMHVFFELEHSFGARVIQISDIPPKYAITFDNGSMNKHLDIWYKRMLSNVSVNGNDPTDYHLWEARFPESHVEDCEKSIKLMKDEIKNT